MKRLLVLALVLAGCNAPAATPIPTAVVHAVTGSITLYSYGSSDNIIPLGATCVSKGGYSDLKEGTPVTLRDESGTILASDRLGGGEGTKTQCTFPFILKGVTDSAKFYSVEVGRRGAISNSHAEMAANGWTFALTLGA